MKLRQPIRKSWKQELMLKLRQEPLYCKEPRLKLKNKLPKLLRNKNWHGRGSKKNSMPKGKTEPKQEKKPKLKHLPRNKKSSKTPSTNKKPLMKPKQLPIWTKLPKPKNSPIRKLSTRKKN